MTTGTAPDDQSAQRYGAGLPRIGTRLLSEHERRTIRRRINRLQIATVTIAVGVIGSACAAAMLVPSLDRDVVTHLGGPGGLMLTATGALGLVTCLFAGRRAWRGLAAMGVLYLLVVAGLDAASDGRPPPAIVTWSVVFGLVVLGNGYLFVRGWHRARVLGRRRRVLSDLDDGAVERFAGRVLSTTGDETLRRLAELGELRIGGSEPHRLELLPRSGLVVRVDGRPLERLEAAYVADVAPAMPHAFRAALPAGLTASATSPRVQLRRRSLTVAERAELEKHIRRLRRRIWPVVSVSIAVAVVVSTQLWNGFRWEALVDGVSLCWYALAAVAWVGYARRIVAARKLAYDRDLRWVVTVDEADANQPDAAPPKLEVLPVSQLAWTENAAPAGWRVSRL